MAIQTTTQALPAQSLPAALGTLAVTLLHLTWSVLVVVAYYTWQVAKLVLIGFIIGFVLSAAFSALAGDNR